MGNAADGLAALELLDRVEVDVLLLDLQMPGWDGIATLQALADRGDLLPTLVLTTFDDPDLVLGALRAGARGYLLKDVELDQLLEAIEVLVEGGTMHLPSVTERLMHAVEKRPTDQPGLLIPEQLTGRETDVLRLMASGMSNPEIAEALDLATGTVKNHVSNVLMKLGVRDRTEAVIKGLEQGMI